MTSESISVIVPYYNEADGILITLDLLYRQTLAPGEIILIDSGSTDDGPGIVDQWITDCEKNGDNPAFIHLRPRTGVPSSSKNAGIRRAAGDLVAFMDCGLSFSEDWLEQQTRFMEASGSEVVSGGVVLEGANRVDRAAAAQTYGYKQFHPCVPSSLVRKSVFEKVGLFLEGRRSGYDVDWINRLKTMGITRGINPKVVVRYSGVNYADSLALLWRKGVTYAKSSVGLHGDQQSYLYLMTISAAGGVVATNLLSLPWLVAAYVAIRGCLIPFWKSGGMRIVAEDPMILATLPVVGAVIDAAKTAGFLQAVFRPTIESVSAEGSNREVG